MSSAVVAGDEYRAWAVPMQPPGSAFRVGATEFRPLRDWGMSRQDARFGTTGAAAATAVILLWWAK
jgi:hypothetical protein